MRIKQNITATWMVMRAAFQLLYGAYKISRVRKPIITIFGATYAKENSLYYDKAYLFAKKCAEHNISIITGGGPGIMYAANCGAQAHKSTGNDITTLGIAVKGVDQEFQNRCTSLLWVDHFSTRKLLLIEYALAIVVFPGGIGTADELFEVLNSLKHKRIDVPVILIGIEFWQPLIVWLKEQPFKHGFMQPGYASLFVITDDIEDAFERIRKICKQCE